MHNVAEEALAHYHGVRKVRGSASVYTCKCGSPAQEWATIHGRSGDKPEDYVALCKRCHAVYDRAGKGSYV